MVTIKRLLLLICCMALYMAPTLAQDTIVYLSGRVMEGKVILVDSLDVQVEVKKRKKTKLLYQAKSDIFAIKYSDGKVDIFYSPINSEEYSIKEMEFFVKGEQDAIAHTKAPILFISGIVSGGVVTAGLGPFLGLIPIVPLTVFGGAIQPKIDEGAVSSPELLREDTYLTGFTTRAKARKVQKAITGSIIGWVGGMIVAGIIAELDPPKK